MADEIPVQVVDSQVGHHGLGTIVLEAARRAEAGASVDEVSKVAQDLARRTRVYGALDTLENLKKGGRIGKAQALLGSILSIKPIIEMRNGEVEPRPEGRTRGRALQYLVDKVVAEPGVENLAVMHGDAPDVEQFLALLAPHYPPDQIVVGDLGAVIGGHGGPRTIGVAFQVSRAPDPSPVVARACPSPIPTGAVVRRRPGVGGRYRLVTDRPGRHGRGVGGRRLVLAGRWR